MKSISNFIKKKHQKNYKKNLKKYSEEDQEFIIKGRNIPKTSEDQGELENRLKIKTEIIITWNKIGKRGTNFKYCECKFPFLFNSLNCKYWLKLGKLNPDYLVNYSKQTPMLYGVIPVKKV